MKNVNTSTSLVVLLAALSLFAIMALAGRPVDFWSTTDQQADKLFSADRFAEAAELYADPTRQGVAHYRAGQFKQAAAAFARVDEPEAAFDRGNALVMLGKYEDAIKSYDRALQFQPQWQQAKDNRAVAVARRDRMAPPEDDAGGTGGELAADEIVFDDRAKNASQTEEIEVGSGDTLSDEEMRQLWLRRVQTKPGDFLRAKFSYQLASREADTK